MLHSLNWLIFVAVLGSKVCSNHIDDVIWFPAVLVTALLVSISDTLILGLVFKVSVQPWRPMTQRWGMVAAWD